MASSVVIITYNSAAFITGNLDSLARQSSPPEQIVVVDNGSSDDTLARAAKFNKVRIISTADNLGYAAAANLGISACDRELTIIANADTYFAPDFIARCEELFAADPELAMLSPLILRFDGKTIDSAGQYPSAAYHPRERAYGRSLKDYSPVQSSIFSVCGAVTVFRSASLKSLALDEEYYDSDFFMFWEDFDIGWRAHNRGLKIMFSPRAVAYHYRGGTISTGSRLRRFSLGLSRPPQLRYHLLKNRYLCLVKNFRLRHLKALPFIMLYDLIWVSIISITAPQILFRLFKTRSLFRAAMKKRAVNISHE